MHSQRSQYMKSGRSPSNQKLIFSGFENHRSSLSSNKHGKSLMSDKTVVMSSTSFSGLKQHTSAVSLGGPSSGSLR